MIKRVLALSAAVLTALVVAGCGSDDTPAAAPSASMPGSPAASASAGVSAAHNDADVMFAQMMIPHHRQAIDMAKMAATRAADSAVKTLAARIQAAQDPEIQTMASWLTAWNAAMPTGMPGMDMGDSSKPSMPGAMSDAEMKKLDSTSGTAFDREFLTMMIKHHQGAIQMAQEEQKNGKNTEAVALAGKVVSDQTAEIGEIRRMLGAE